MQYYKELDLDFSSVIPKLIEFTTKNEATHFWTPIDTQKTLHQIPEFFDVLDPLGLSIKRIVIITAISPRGYIHRDVSEFKSRMNIPILNCQYSTTSFFTCDESYLGEKRYSSSKAPYVFFNRNQCTEVDSFTLNKPTLLRIQELHQVRVNDISKIPRISCSIGFNEDIEHLWSA